MAVCSAAALLAHSGRTDSRGGHHDRENGGYHYHSSGSSTFSRSSTPVAPSQGLYYPQPTIQNSTGAFAPPNSSGMHSSTQRINPLLLKSVLIGEKPLKPEQIYVLPHNIELRTIPSADAKPTTIIIGSHIKVSSTVTLEEQWYLVSAIVPGISEVLTGWILEKDVIPLINGRLSGTD